MKTILKQSILLLSSALYFLACSSTPSEEKPSDVYIIYNQVGYITYAPKLLMVSEDINKVVFIDQDGSEVLSMTPDAAKYWDQSGDAVRKVDFSEISDPGTYVVLLPEVNENVEIHINDRPFLEVTKTALKAFYYNRAGMAIEPEFGGQWARPAGHPDSVVYIHSSAADENRPEGTVISSPYGWYDAGDYNKYIVNSGITTYTLMRALEDFAGYYEKLEVNIPETGSGVPDLLSEILYNLKWILTMQDPNDGGVYHKLTTKNFEGMVMPHEAVSDRFVVAKGTAAALNFAAVAAKAYRILQVYERYFPGLADECLKKAEKAWEWAMDNPETPYEQPDDIYTGMYGDGDFNDEFFWAAAELYLATGSEQYLEELIQRYTSPAVPGWNRVEALGFMSLLTHYDEFPDQLKQTSLKNDFINLVDDLVETSKIAPYGVSIQRFVWGSNSQVANEGMLKLFGYQLTENPDYLHSALSDLDYILGRNATGYCFVTGFGDQKVMNIHHRPSEADENEQPVPGFLAGGPNLSVLDDCGSEIASLRSPYPAKSYLDLECSYSTNEIAINWNAPLVYLAGGIDALFREVGSGK